MVDQKEKTVPRHLRRRTFEQSKNWARRHGWLWEVVPDDVLFLDIYTSEQSFQYGLMLPSLKVLYPYKDIRVTPTKSGNTHVRIFLEKPLDLPTRVALQLMLGSDPRKEASSLLGIKDGDPYPILAFEVNKDYLCIPSAFNTYNM